MGTVAASRNYYLAKGLAAGSRASVLTAKYRYRVSPEKVDTEEFEVYPLRNLDYRWMSGLGNRSGTSGRIGRDHSSMTTFGFGRKVLDSFPTNLLIGEGGLNYILAGYRKGKKLIIAKGIKYIYSSYRPYSDHVIAYLLKRKYPHLFWIADFGDLHIDPVMDNVYWKKFQERCNARILKQADLITSVSDGLIRRLARFNQNTFVVPNGIVPKREQQKVSSLDEFTISYTGSLYGQRDLSFLFGVLRKLIREEKISRDHFQLVYAGSNTSIWDEWTDQFGLSEYSKTLGDIDHSEALDVQRNSHLNILLTWANPEVQGWMTYKVYEYIQAGNPIIACISGSMDVELKAFIDRYNNGIVIVNDPSYETILSKFILSRYFAWLQGMNSPKVDLTEFYQMYSWNNIADRLSDQIGMMTE